jgi:hypothetical protein
MLGIGELKAMKGWVYVITNKAMPGIIKVGFSMKDPEIRAAELNHTGSPHPYVVDYEVLVEEPQYIEQQVHGRLRNQREGKEWFRCSTEEAIATIKEVVGTQAQVENYKRADRERAEAIRRQREDNERILHSLEEKIRNREYQLEFERKKVIDTHNCWLEDNISSKFGRLFLLFFIFLFPIILLCFIHFNPKVSGLLLILSAICSFMVSGLLSICIYEIKQNLPETKAVISAYNDALMAIYRELAAIKIVKEKMGYGEQSKL